MTLKDSMFSKSGQHIAIEELILETNLKSTGDVIILRSQNFSMSESVAFIKFALSRLRLTDRYW